MQHWWAGKSPSKAAEKCYSICCGQITDVSLLMKFKKVAHHFNIKIADMFSARRSRQIARPRQIAMYLAKNLTSMSYPEIGKRFGNRDHTTIMHAIRKVEELMEQDAGLCDDVNLLKSLLVDQ